MVIKVRLSLFFVFVFLFPCVLFSNSVSVVGFADMVEGLIPAVVNISTEHKVGVKSNARGNLFNSIPQGSLFEEFRDLFERLEPFMEEGGTRETRTAVSLGSGFVISKDGLIVTNRHVVTTEGSVVSENITVTFSDNSQLTARIIETDLRTDLAVLKVEAIKDLPYLEFDDSDNARVGDWAIAIGNPFGLGGSVSAGIVSARGRDIDIGTHHAGDFIQTDAAINRGNSGGPLFNTAGKVIGINTSIVSTSGGNIGIGFALPSNAAIPVINKLAKGERFERGWLGVKVQSVTQEIAKSIGQKEPRGALVVEVTDGSPAQKVGVEVGDVITNFNGVKIVRMKDLLKAVSSSEPGSVVDMTVMRNTGDKKKNITLKLNVEKLNEDKKSLSDGIQIKEYKQLGIKVSGLSSVVMGKNIDNPEKGVVILEVTDINESNKVLRKGDVIIKVGSTYIEDLNHFDKVLNEIQNKASSVLFLINRRGENLFVVMQFDK